MTDWLTPNEAAAHVRAKSPRTIKDAIKSGALPAYFYGTGNRDIRVKKDELDAWMESRPYEPPSQRTA